MSDPRCHRAVAVPHAVHAICTADRALITYCCTDAVNLLSANQLCSGSQPHVLHPCTLRYHHPRSQSTLACPIVLLNCMALPQACRFSAPCPFFILCTVMYFCCCYHVSSFHDEIQIIIILKTRDYFDATASNWNTSAHHAPWRVSLYKDRQSNRRVGVF